MQTNYIHRVTRFGHSLAYAAPVVPDYATIHAPKGYVKFRLKFPPSRISRSARGRACFYQLERAGMRCVVLVNSPQAKDHPLRDSLLNFGRFALTKTWNGYDGGVIIRGGEVLAVKESSVVFDILLYHYPEVFPKAYRKKLTLKQEEF